MGVVGFTRRGYRLDIKSLCDPRSTQSLLPERGSKDAMN